MSEHERWAPEPHRDGDVRGATARDRARVLHSGALRRLAGKTQVVGVAEPDVPRTRLTHSLEVAQIGREMGAALGCDADVVELAGLAHDLGHPPFGHNGEAALDAAAGACGGFEGNAQTLRELTRLEVKVRHADGRSAGLNLTRTSLDACTKYPWPRGEQGLAARKYGVYAQDAEVFAWLRAGAPEGRRRLEAQVMDWADDVAYSVHDLEDGVHAGHVDLAALRQDTEVAPLVDVARAAYVPDEPEGALASTWEDLRALPLWPSSFDGTTASLVALKRLTSGLISRLVRAATDATTHAQGPHPPFAADLLVPEQARRECALLKAVTARHVMARPGAAALQAEQRALLRAVVEEWLAREGRDLPPDLREAWDAADDDAGRCRAVLDGVARLTDDGAVAAARRLAG